MVYYFRFWLLAPLLLGLVGLLVPSISTGVVSFAGTALLVVAAPYAVFVIGALVWSRHRSEAQYKLAFLVSPLVFGVCCFGYLLMISPGMRHDGESWLLIAMTGLGFAQMCALVSAAYCWPPLALWYAIAFLRRA